jgi:hypothetical protein
LAEVALPTRVAATGADVVIRRYSTRRPEAADFAWKVVATGASGAAKRARLTRGSAGPSTATKRTEAQAGSLEALAALADGALPVRTGTAANEVSNDMANIAGKRGHAEPGKRWRMQRM